MHYKILGDGTKRKYNFHNKAIKSSEYAYDAIPYSMPGHCLCHCLLLYYLPYKICGWYNIIWGVWSLGSNEKFQIKTFIV